MPLLPAPALASFLALLVLAASAPAPGQTPGQQIAFDAAIRAREGGFAEKAASDFAEFIRLHPDSPLAPHASLIEARARLDIGQPDAAIATLTRHLERWDSLKDQALHLLGEVQLHGNRFHDAARAYRRLVTETPESPLLLQAAFAEAMATFRARDFERAISLLDDPNGAFRRAAERQPDDESSVRGTLLLAEAQIRAGLPATARLTLDRLADRPLTPSQAWDREWIATSLLLAQRQTDAALVASSNLLALAHTAASRDLAARSHAMRADVLRQAGRMADAFATLTNNLASDAPAAWRRDALLAVAELPLLPPQLDPAIHLLSSLASGPPQDLTASAARVALAELRLQQHFGPPSPASSNALPEARSLLQFVLTNAPSPALEGRAWFNLGWTELAAGRPSPATDAFARAVARLEGSPLQALAIFKLADGLQQAAQHEPALQHFLRLIREFGGRPPVRGAILERALYQGALAALEAGQHDIAHDLAQRAVVEFPNGEFRDDTRVLYGQTLARLDSPVRARTLLQRLGAQFTNSPALPEIQLAAARSLLQDGSWSNALHQLDDWTRSYPNHSGMARAEFERAWAAYKAADHARAHSLFTNFLARFPDHPSAPQAQVWVGDHHFRQGNFVAAEASYQIVFQRTNWPVSRLTHEARLMAGRAAFVRQGYRDAKDYFRWLIENGPPAVPNSLIPPELVAQAWFAFGDCFIEEPESDSRLSDAMTAFTRLIEQLPHTREALLARGKLADCHLQSASLDPALAPAAYTNAALLYLDVLQAPNAPVSIRSQAEVGLGLVREKQAALLDPAPRQTRIEEALAHHLNVFHFRNLRPGELASPFWVNRAGLEAARLAESLGRRDQASHVYETLAQTFPSSATAFRQRAAQLRAP
ncbi:MAG: tetratricopeptide repeat protein [Verrucomicrobiae bacterium]|nr:tetratricopeptide repeat protein [Verrucomicrobiae bacterium]